MANPKAVYKGPIRRLPHGVVLEPNVAYEIEIVSPSFGYSAYMVHVHTDPCIYIPYPDQIYIWDEWTLCND